MKQTKIDWCDCTINPVVGCSNGCPYCYARKINDRFHFIDDWNKPQFFPEKLKQLNSKKPKSIFMDSMSDLAYWEMKWCNDVADYMNKNQQHNYIFLTKNISNRYNDGVNEMIFWKKFYEWRNVFIGKTINFNKQFSPMEQFDFLSIEPILEPIDLSSIQYSLYTKQVIIGAETGNRKGKVIPKKEWIDDIVKQCDIANVKVFMKSSLKEIMGDDFRQDKLLWEVK